MANPILTIVDVNTEYAVAVWYDTDKIIYLDINKLPDNIAVGDKFYHVEHGCIVDIYDKDDVFKNGLFNYKKAIISVNESHD